MEQKNTLTFLVGPPGSGKTTYANKHLKNDNTVILSSDEMRAKLLSDENDQSNQTLVFEKLYEHAKKALTEKKNVVLDSTNTNKFLRQKALEDFKDFDAIKIAIVFNTTKTECIRRDKNRMRVVGAKVIERYFKTKSAPTEEEGFDKIIKIK